MENYSSDILNAEYLPSTLMIEDAAADFDPDEAQIYSNVTTGGEIRDAFDTMQFHRYFFIGKLPYSNVSRSNRKNWKNSKFFFIGRKWTNTFVGATLRTRSSQGWSRKLNRVLGYRKRINTKITDRMITWWETKDPLPTVIGFRGKAYKMGIIIIIIIVIILFYCNNFI